MRKNRRDWQVLFHFFTKKLDPSIRKGVFNAIANIDIPIIANAFWNCEGDCCLLVFTVMAAMHDATTPLSRFDIQSLAYTIQLADIPRTLKISEGKAKRLRYIWDHLSSGQRADFRIAIRAHVKKLEEEAAFANPVFSQSFIAQIEEAHASVLRDEEFVPA